MDIPYAQFFNSNAQSAYPYNSQNSKEYTININLYRQLDYVSVG